MLHSQVLRLQIVADSEVHAVASDEFDGFCTDALLQSHPSVFHFVAIESIESDANSAILPVLKERDLDVCVSIGHVFDPVARFPKLSQTFSIYAKGTRS